MNETEQEQYVTGPAQETAAEEVPPQEAEKLPEEEQPDVQETPVTGTVYSDPFFNVPPVQSELAGLDKEAFWGSVAAAKKKRRRPSAAVIILALLMLAAMVLILLTAVNGRGWLIRLINGGKSIEFTLPIEEKPQLDSSFYQEDGRYTLEGVAEAVMPSVVSIEIYSGAADLLPSSQGSGIIMTADGYILTNAHVVDDASKIKVVLNTREEYAADLIGTDEATDIAIIKIGKKGLTPAQFGNSDEVQLGEDAVVIGSPAGFYGSVTKGVVSGLNRLIRVESYSVPMSCIQVDAAINPGNSGGALVNMWGQVVGITSSKLASKTYYGIGFAIEINAAKPIIEELMAKGYVAEWARIGITFYSVSEDNAVMSGVKAGLYVVEIDPECDIANTELKPGDIITMLDGKYVSTSEEVKALLEQRKPGDIMTGKVFRPDEEGGGTEFEISFKLMSEKGSLVPAEN